MDFSVLTPDFKQQLEQQLDRLISERDAIVQSAIEQATSTIDANLSHINALLGKTDDKPNVLTLKPLVEEPVAKTPVDKTPIDKMPVAKTPSTKTKNKQPIAIVPEPEVMSRESAKASKAAQKEKASQSPSSVFNALKVSKASKASKAPKKGTPKSASIDGPQLKPDFQGLELADAIPAVFRQDPDRRFLIDDVIEALYGPIDDAILPKTRQRVAVSLGHSSRREEVLKVQENPSIYRLNA